MKPDGGPAFPTAGTPAYPHDAGCGDRYTVDARPGLPGMSLRDYFAAHAVQGVLAQWRSTVPPELDALAREAYRVADAMLAERSKP